MTKWLYTGDINLECGGTFYRVEDNTAYYVQIVPESDVGGPDNVFMICEGECQLDAITKDSVDEFYRPDTKETYTAEEIAIVAVYEGHIEIKESHFIRIGKHDIYARRVSNWNPVQVNANWKLKNYIRKNFL